MAGRDLLVLGLLVGVTLVGAGCLEQARDTLGAEPSHRWETKATLQESVSTSESLVGGELPTKTREASFTVPMGSTDVRLTVDVEVGGGGNVTVELADPSETVYSRAFDASGEDVYQSGSPTTGQWSLEAVLRGDSSVTVRVDARVPVD